MHPLQHRLMHRRPHLLLRQPVIPLRYLRPLRHLRPLPRPLMHPRMLPVLHLRPPPRLLLRPHRRPPRVSTAFTAVSRRTWIVAAVIALLADRARAASWAATARAVSVLATTHATRTRRRQRQRLCRPVRLRLCRPMRRRRRRRHLQRRHRVLRRVLRRRRRLPTHLRLLLLLHRLVRRLLYLLRRRRTRPRLLPLLHRRLHRLQLRRLLLLPCPLLRPLQTRLRMHATTVVTDATLQVAAFATGVGSMTTGTALARTITIVRLAATLRTPDTSVWR